MFCIYRSLSIKLSVLSWPSSDVPALARRYLGDNDSLKIDDAASFRMSLTPSRNRHDEYAKIQLYLLQVFP